VNDAVEGFGEKDGGRASDVVDRTQLYHRRNYETAQRQCQQAEAFYRDPAVHQLTATVATGVFRRRDDLSNRLTWRLDCRHSPSNEGSDGRRRTVTVFAGIRPKFHLARLYTTQNVQLCRASRAKFDVSSPCILACRTARLDSIDTSNSTGSTSTGSTRLTRRERQA